MKRSLFAGAALLAAVVLPAGANAQNTIKIGVVLPYSGQFADGSKQIDERHQTLHETAWRHRRRQEDRNYPQGHWRHRSAVAKRLAEELVVRDKVDILAGLLLTPNAIAGCDVSAEAKKFMVIMNAATSIIVDKSPYCTRASITLPIVTQTLGAWAEKNGIKKAYTMVSDYAPGTMRRTDSQPDSRPAAAKSSARSAWRPPIRISRPSFSAPRT